MNKLAIRYLGIGIFFSGAALTAYNAFSPTVATSDSDLESAYNASQEELETVKQQLAELQLSLDKAQNANQNVNTEATPVRTIITIEAGMTSSEVGTLLENIQVIESKSEFEDYLEENKLSSKIQVGKYELNSDMSIQQIVEILTN